MDTRSMVRSQAQVIPTKRGTFWHWWLAVVLLAVLAFTVLALRRVPPADPVLLITEAEQRAFEAGYMAGREEMATLAAQAYAKGHADGISVATGGKR